MRVPTEDIIEDMKNAETTETEEVMTRRKLVLGRKPTEPITVRIPKRRQKTVSVERMKAGQRLTLAIPPRDARLRKLLDEYVDNENILQKDVCIAGAYVGNGKFVEIYQLKEDAEAIIQEPTDTVLSVCTVQLLQKQMVETVDFPPNCNILPICYEGEICTRDVFGMMCDRYIVAPITKVVEIVQRRLSLSSCSTEQKSLQEDLQRLGLMA